MTTVLKVLGTFAATVMRYFAGGLVLSLLWRWFVVPWTSELGLMRAIGLIMIADLFMMPIGTAIVVAAAPTQRKGEWFSTSMSVSCAVVLGAMLTLAYGFALHWMAP